MLNTFITRGLITLAILTLPCVARATVTLGQIDTFQDGTTDNWTVGGAGTLDLRDQCVVALDRGDVGQAENR